jgi:hypothetical protein
VSRLRNWPGPEAAISGSPLFASLNLRSDDSAFNRRRVVGVPQLWVRIVLIETPLEANAEGEIFIVLIEADRLPNYLDERAHSRNERRWLGLCGQCSAFSALAMVWLGAAIVFFVFGRDPDRLTTTLINAMFMAAAIAGAALWHSGWELLR